MVHGANFRYHIFLYITHTFLPLPSSHPSPASWGKLWCALYEEKGSSWAWKVGVGSNGTINCHGSLLPPCPCCCQISRPMGSYPCQPHAGLRQRTELVCDHTPHANPECSPGPDVWLQSLHTVPAQRATPN